MKNPRRSLVLSSIVALTAVSCTRAVKNSSIEYDLARSDIVAAGTLETIEILGEENLGDRPNVPKALAHARWIHGRGTLRVQEPIWGPTRAFELMTISWIRAVGFEDLGVRPDSPFEEPASIDYQSLIGVERIWLLSRSPDGGLNERLVVKLEGREVIEETLRENPIRVMQPGQNQAGDPVIVQVEFRNATENVMTVPTMEARGGVMVFGSRLHLRLFQHLMDSNRDEKMTAGQGFQFDERLPDRGVEPHASSSFSLDLAKAYELKPCVGYYLSLRVDGLPGHVFDLVMIAPRGGTTLDCWKGKASESLPRSLPSPKNP